MRSKTIRVLLQVASLLVVVHPVVAGEDKTDPEVELYQAGARALADRDYDEAISIWKRVARKGNADASFNLGVLYAEGVVVEPDPREAMRWFKKAARDGHAEAQYNLGHFYMQGATGKPKPKKAVRWWREAAQRGLLVAQYNLAYALYHGIGTDANQEEALKWFRRAAADGEKRSSAFLATLADPEYEVVRDSASPAGDSAKHISASVGGPDSRATVVGRPASPSERPALFTSASDASQEQPADAAIAEFAAVPAEAVEEKLSPISDSDREQLQDIAFNDHGWLFSQHSDNFTLQLASLRLVSSIEKMAQDDEFVKKDGKFFITLIDGKRWIYLLYGSYPDTESAMATRASLPSWAQEGLLRNIFKQQSQRCASRDSLRLVLDQDEMTDLERYCTAVKGYQ